MATKRKQKLIEINEKRFKDLETLSEILDLPTSVLIRMGITLIVRKYHKELKEARQAFEIMRRL